MPETICQGIVSPCFRPQSAVAPRCFANTFNATWELQVGSVSPRLRITSCPCCKQSLLNWTELGCGWCVRSQRTCLFICPAAVIDGMHRLSVQIELHLYYSESAVILQSIFSHSITDGTLMSPGSVSVYLQVRVDLCSALTCKLISVNNQCTVFRSGEERTRYVVDHST